MYTENWQASPGKFKVIGLDTFSHEDWIEGEYDTKEEAIKKAKSITKGNDMTLARVYDDKENQLFQCGKY